MGLEQNFLKGNKGSSRQMEKVKIIIGRAEDGTFSAYSEEYPIFGMGDSVEEAKVEAENGLKLYIENNEEIPELFSKEYELVYQMDVQSLLEYYKGIFTNAAFERITGINQKQIQHYASGFRNPKTETKHKIENALHKLGQELLAVEL